MNRVTLRQIKERVNAFIKSELGIDGVTGECTTATFDSDSATVKVEFFDKTEGETSLAEKNWHIYAEMNGMKKEWLWKGIEINDKLFAIAGFKPNARKNSVLIRARNGKTFVTTPRTVIRKLG